MVVTNVAESVEWLKKCLAIFFGRYVSADLADGYPTTFQIFRDG